jgi:pilus assembly protein CpaB
MNGKSMAMLGLAALSGLGAMFGTSRMLAKNQNRVTSETQDVIVAVKDLKVEEVLTPELVKVVPMPKASVPAGTFTSFKDVQDRWVSIKTLEGEPILDRKLAPKGSPAGLVSRIHPGMRAFTLEVNEHTGVSGFILPDHRVDVVLSVRSHNGKDDAETLLQDIPVLASGQVFTRPEDRSIQSRTVTLEVSPEQVDTLVAALAKGALSLSLRGLNDHRTTARVKPAPPPEPAPVVIAAKPVELPLPPPPPPPPAPKEPKAAPAPERRFVWIYRGLQNSERVSLSRDAAEESAADEAFPPIEQ